MTLINLIIIICCIKQAHLLLLNVTDDFLVCSNEIKKNIEIKDVCYDNESCKIIRSIIKVKDEFHFFKDRFNNSIVLYSINHQIFETICERAKEIIIQDEIKSNICVRDLLVAYSLRNMFQPGFMTSIGIIRKKTIEIECDKIPRVFVSPNKSLNILKINNNITFSFNSVNNSYLKKTMNPHQDKIFLSVTIYDNTTNRTNLDYPKRSAHLDEDITAKELNYLEIIQIILLCVTILFLFFLTYLRYLCNKKSQKLSWAINENNIKKYIKDFSINNSLLNNQTSHSTNCDSSEINKLIDSKFDNFEHFIINKLDEIKNNSNMTAECNLKTLTTETNKLLSKFETITQSFQTRETKKDSNPLANSVNTSFDKKNDFLDKKIKEVSIKVQNSIFC